MAHTSSIIAVAVTYNSGLEYREHFEALLPQVDYFVIIDNDSDRETVKLLKKLVEEYSDKLDVIFNDTNLGLGKAQNIGIQHAINKGGDWVLLMDDDSIAEPNMVEAMLKAYEQNPEKKQIGVISPRMQDANSGIEFPCLVNKGFWYERAKLEDRLYLNDLFVAMASGSLIKKAVLEDIGLMREDLFIDYIDWEFCARARAHGWNIMAAGDTLLRHSLGDKTVHKVFGKTFVAINQPPSRRYTNARNMIIFWRLYGFKHAPSLSYTATATAYDTFRIIIFEEERFAKILSMTKGLIAGLFARNIRQDPPHLA